MLAAHSGMEAEEIKDELDADLETTQLVVR